MSARLLMIVVATAVGIPATAQEDPVAEGAALFRAARYDDARAALTASAQSGTHAGAAYYLGRIAFAQERYEEAVRWLEQAARMDPGEPAIPLWLGNAYARAAFEAPFWRKPSLGLKARDAWQSSVEIDPVNPDALQYLASWYLAVPELLGGDVQRARGYATALARIAPYTGGMALARIDAEHRADSAAAESRYHALAREYPDSTAPVQRLSTLLARQGRLEEAFAILDARLARQPDEAALLIHLGRLAATSGARLDHGAIALRHLIDQQEGPPVPATHYWLGRILEQQGDTAAARAEYRTTLLAAPGDAGASRGLRRLGSTP